MSTTKVGITINNDLLKRLDQLVAEQRFPSRSRAIQEAIFEHLSRMDLNRLATECAKLDPVFEQNMADEGLGEDGTEWPEY